MRVTHRPENCWARDEHEGKATELLGRIENSTDTAEANVQSAFIAPNEHTFYLMVESETVEGVTTLLGPPVLQDHDADVVPVMTFGETLDTLDVQ